MDPMEAGMREGERLARIANRRDAIRFILLVLAAAVPGLVALWLEGK